MNFEALDKQKVLIIGGNRFFGKRLVHILLKRNLEVTVLNRGNRSPDLESGFEHIQLDRKHLRPDHPSLANRQWDIIFDQCCYDATDAKIACDVFKARAKMYIFTSSQSVYGLGSELLESDFDPYSHKFETIADRDKNYGEAKRQAEAVFFQNASFPVVAVRFPIVVGEDDYTERLKFHIERIQNQEPLFFPNTQARLSLIHAQDAAEFLASLVEHPHLEITGPINCCSQEPIRLLDLLQTIEGVVGRATVLSEDPKTNHSPYGIEGDWYMNIDKLAQYGLKPRPISSWIPEVVKQLSQKCNP